MERANKVMKSDKLTHRDHISHDVAYQIMSKLPLKSLVRFSILNKQWTATIGGKEFSSDFLSQSMGKLKLLLSCLEKENGCLVMFFSLPQMNIGQVVRAQPLSCLNTSNTSSLLMCQPINGLVCCHKDTNSLVCNPNSGTYINVPDATTPSFYFLGFDPINKDFKLLSVSLSSSNYQCQVITLGQDKWRPINNPSGHLPPWHRTGNRGIYIDGVIYYESDQMNKWRYWACLRRFNLASGVFEASIKLHRDVRIDKHGTTSLVKLHNHVAVFQATHPKPSFKIWTLDDPVQSVWSYRSVEIPTWKQVVGDLLSVDDFQCLG